MHDFIEAFEVTSPKLPDCGQFLWPVEICLRSVPREPVPYLLSEQLFRGLGKAIEPLGIRGKSFVARGTGPAGPDHSPRASSRPKRRAGRAGLTVSPGPAVTVRRPTRNRMRPSRTVNDSSWLGWR